MATYHFSVNGRVQGVGYRTFVKHYAEDHGLGGEVWNCFDGSVAGKVSCPGEEAAAAFRQRLKEGPGRVDSVEWHEVLDEFFEGFEVTESRQSGL